jgi:tetratricopeptide (TPR) repeat protein
MREKISDPETTGMEIISLQETFDLGRSQAEAGQFRDALPHFQKMLKQVKETSNGKFSEPMHQSYYALCMTMVFGPSREAIQLSERAVSKEFYNPDLYCNLGLVYMRCGKRGPAFRAFQRGLALNRKHIRTLRALQKYEMRQPPTFRFLSRGHFLNRLAGRIRYRLGGESD